MPNKESPSEKPKFNIQNDPMGSDVYDPNFMELSSTINNSINKVLNLLPQIFKKKHILEMYAKDLSNGSTNAPLHVYFEKYKDLSFPELDDVLNSFRFLNEKSDLLTFPHGSNESNTNGNMTDNGEVNNQFEDAPTTDKIRISRQKQLRTNQSYREVLSFLPGTDIPDIDLNNQAKSVRDIWNEWNYGYKGKPPLGEIELRYGTKWRRGRIAKSAQRRKKIVEFIQSEFRNHSDKIINIQNVVDELDRYRLTRGKGLFWLYGNIPERLYNEHGNPLTENDGQMLVRHDYQQHRNDNDLELDNGDILLKKEDTLERVSHEDLVDSATAAVLAQQDSQSSQDHDEGEGEENDDDDDDESVEEVQRTQQHQQQQQDSTQSTEGDLRRLENIQRLIDQHESVGMSELGEHTDPELEKL